MPARRTRKPQLTTHATPPSASTAHADAHVDTPLGRMRCALYAADAYKAALAVVREQPHSCECCTMASAAAMMVLYQAELNGISIELALLGIEAIVEDLASIRRRHVTPGSETIQ